MGEFSHILRSGRILLTSDIPGERELLLCIDVDANLQWRSLLNQSNQTWAIAVPMVSRYLGTFKEDNRLITLQRSREWVVKKWKISKQKKGTIEGDDVHFLYRSIRSPCLVPLASTDSLRESQAAAF